MNDEALFWLVYVLIISVWVAALALQHRAEMRRKPPAVLPGVQVIQVSSETVEAEGYDGTD